MTWLFLKRFGIGIALFLLCISLLWVPRFDVSDPEVGVTFIPSQISESGLDPAQTFQKVISEIKPDYIKIPLEWSRIEPASGEYSFSEITNLLSIARRSQVKTVVLVGYETGMSNCDEPAWVSNLSEQEYATAFRNFVLVSSSRLKAHQGLTLWEVESRDNTSCKHISNDSVDDVIALIAARDTRPILSREDADTVSIRVIDVEKTRMPAVLVHEELRRSGYISGEKSFVVNIVGVSHPNELVRVVSHARAIGARTIFLGDVSVWYRAQERGDDSWITTVLNILKLM